jgi:ABC-type spermidine/putrescine transport system permease subunit I
VHDLRASVSTAQILTPGLSAWTAEPTPVMRPPPPTLTKTSLMSGTSSTSSKPCANAIRRFRDITHPSMKGISFVAVLLAWIGSFMNFAIVQVMTAGGPANASEVFATLVYKNAFIYADASYAATLGILLLALLMIPGGLYVRATMRSTRG